jgi:peptide/nickel transport system ATP-binding protein
MQYNRRYSSTLFNHQEVGYLEVTTKSSVVPNWNPNLESAMSETVLDVRDLRIVFRGEENKPMVAVDGISFALQRGQTLGIVGESGSGKSVTSLGIMGLVPYPGKVTRGEIWFHGLTDGAKPLDLQKLSEAQRREYRGGQIAMIFQEPMSSLNPVYNIGFQMTEAIRLHQNVSEAEARRQAIARLQEVRLLPSDEVLQEQYADVGGERDIQQAINEHKQRMLQRYPHELSGGQLQRVMIAIAISCDPTLLIADEPTTALDVTVQAAILDLLRDLCRARDMSLIFITHDLGVIAEIANQVIVMYRGKIVESGTIEQIFYQPQHPYTKGLLACRPRLDYAPVYLPTVSDFMTVREEKGEMIIEEKVTNPPPQVDEESARILPKPDFKQKPLLEVKDLRVGYPQKGIFGRTQKYFMAVKDVSFSVYPGETLGLVGESGCGKSTLARALLRLVPHLNGEIWFNGREISDYKGKELRNLRRKMQIVFQNPYNSLNPRQTIGQTVIEPLIIHNYKSKKERIERAAYLLERVGLNPAVMKRYPHEFSGGQRQRVCIARALALNPEFIICDESVSALDVSVQAQVLNLLKELQDEFGLTYIFISHDLSVVKFMSDRVIVMNQGIIEEIGTAQELYRNPQSDYTRQLIASIPTGEVQRV